MPVLSCGGMRYQHGWQDMDPADIPADGQANLEATIRRSLELGINHIETARGYGSSEVQLGQILPHLPRDEMIIQTKIGPTVTGDEFRKIAETSMNKLQLDHVDLLSIHGINNDEALGRTLKKGGSLEAVQHLRDEGVSRFIGFSTHGPTDVILTAIETGAFDYINLHWYYFDQHNAAMIDAARKQDMGVFIISPTDKGGKLYEPPAKLVELCDPLTPMAFNDLFCLARPDVHTLSIGAARPSDFDAHLAALPYLSDPEATLRPILERLEAALVEKVGATWAQNWRSGLPRFEHVPGQTNVYHILRLYNLAAAYDMLGYAKMRYNLLGNGDSWFPGTKVDSIDWDKLDDVIADCPVKAEIPEKLRAAHALMNEKPEKRLSESA